MNIGRSFNIQPVLKKTNNKLKPKQIKIEKLVDDIGHHNENKTKMRYGTNLNTEV